jgi:hypothetical protein
MKHPKAKMSPAEQDFLRAWNQLSREKRIEWSLVTAELMMLASPEHLEIRRKALRDPSIRIPKPSWRFRMRKTRRGRQLEIYEVSEGWSDVGKWDSDAG